MKDPGPVTADRTAPAECAAFLLATPAGLLDPARAVCVVRLAAAAGCGESRREEWFTAAEQAEIERAGRPRRRQEKRAGKLAAKLAVRDWLARRGGDLPGLGEIEILADAGAPRAGCPGPSRWRADIQALQVSISHAGDLACAAAGAQAVGIDVEPETPPGGDGPAPEIFSQQEAVLKAAGLGLAAGLDAVRLAPAHAGTTDAVCQGCRYRVMLARAHGAWFALAVHRPEPEDLPDSREPEMPTTSIQEVMWFMNQLDGFGATHNVVRSWRLRGPLDAGALARSIQDIAARHATLREVFRNEAGECRARVRAVPDIPLPRESFRHLPEEEARQRVAARCREETQRPFDLEQGPLLRFFLFETAPGEHLLLLVIHHIIIDADALQTFRRDLAACYAARAAGRVPELPPLKLTFADYARRERARLTPARTAVCLDYWRQALAGAPELLRLPLDHPRPPYPVFRSGNISVELRGEVVQALRDLRAAEGVSLFTVLLAAFAVYMLRLSGQDDVVVGVPFVDRREPETRDLIGCFVNLLPVRVNLAGAATFRGLLPRVQAALRGAVAHHELPFHILAEQLAPHRQTAHPPVFQTSALLLHEHTAGVDLPGLEQEFHVLPAGGSTCDLNLHVELAGTGAQVRFEYAAALFETSTVRRLAEEFTAGLERLAAHPDETLPGGAGSGGAELQAPSAPPPEEWTAGPVEPRPATGLHRLFETRSAEQPDRPAVFCAGSEWTYGELNARANRLARRLRELGVEPDALVGICAERSLELILGLLAILKAGGAYLPLDPGYPRERLACMLDDARPVAILADRTSAAALPESAGPLVWLEDFAGAVPDEAAGNLSGGAGPEHLAYVIYTSGSTGRPKGVMVEHRAAVNYVLSAAAEFRLGPADRMLQFASINFDASVEEVFATLASGAALVLRTEEMIRTAEHFLALCRQWGVTVLDLPTAYWSQLATELDRAHLALPPAIRLAVIGGESAPPGALAAWRRTAGGRVRLLNTYGPTEATIVATWIDLTERPGAEARAPIGRPVPNVRALVLDAGLQPVPAGAAGELCLGGAGLARGYLHQPELTAQRFVQVPDDRGGNLRVYRTGDLARFLPDGNLEFAGRQDRQVKLRGFRIELDEIEAVLARHPGVGACAVVVREDGPGGRQLVAYTVAAAGAGAPAAEALRGFLRQRLPDYMVPAAFVTLDRLPAGPGGKIDRQALPPPSRQTGGTGSGADNPRTLAEETLAAIWSEVLGLERVGIHDNFFDSGGHSLLGVRLISRIRSVFRCDLPLRTLFLSPTIAELAQALQAGDGAGGAGRTHLLEVQKGRGGAPLFFVPGGGGGENVLMVYARMLRQLGEDLPIFGFRAWGQDGRTRPRNHVRGLAAAFLAELREVQPRGPYSLAGECLGGVLAFEMARQLEAAGEHVAFLGMLDTSCPSLRAFVKSSLLQAGRRLRQGRELVARAWRERRWTGLPEALAGTVLQFGNDLGFVRRHPRADETPERMRNRIQRVNTAYARMLLRYRPRPFGGKVTLLLTEDFTPLSDPPAAWSRWARGGLEIRRVPGNHENYVRDLSAGTGRLLAECLARARAAARP